MPRGGAKPGERRGGRQKGTPNKLTVATASAREAASKHGPDAIKTLAAIMKDVDSPPAARVMASREILDRWAGKATQPVSGPDGEALQVPHSVQFVISQLEGSNNRT